MDYKQECVDFFENYEVELDRTKHQINEKAKSDKEYLKKREDELIEFALERKDNGDKWFYFKYVEKTNLPNVCLVG